MKGKRFRRCGHYHLKRRITKYVWHDVPIEVQCTNGAIRGYKLCRRHTFAEYKYYLNESRKTAKLAEKLRKILDV